MKDIKTPSENPATINNEKKEEEKKSPSAKLNPYRFSVSQTCKVEARQNGPFEDNNDKGPRYGF